MPVARQNAQGGNVKDSVAALQSASPAPALPNNS
jgi:hypothetical protein